MNENYREETLLTPGEVAARFRVDPKTVTRWANAGKLTAVRTLGGHRRYRRSEVDELLVANGLGAGMTTDAVR
ncbi:BldC family transcriptional regulator [Georgenia sp. 311]|uniref:BldC family transcriptional regulator n=1 Tax=Georgenia wutianyii TaxID=2585135 RepID=A0ABX5VS99_9MICO|nr:MULTISPECIES: BldC family transcriptional regulator [Georgenia]QDB80408.1 BldC family transcriptional regulator [Georgenia wutianyii]TNC21369.1 BldC family transcriptional regulator [Georgenia sp. 311]